MPSAASADSAARISHLAGNTAASRKSDASRIFGKLSSFPEAALAAVPPADLHGPRCFGIAPEDGRSLAAI